MKRYMKFAVAMACALAFGLSACSDDDDAVKSVLNDPTLANVSESVSSLTFSWDKVEGATQYGYELTDPDGNMVTTDVTKYTTVRFTGLRPATTYTLSVWAYSKVYGDVGTSKIATLTGTTASTEPLATPTLTAEVAAGVATVSWEEVPHATSYIYSYTAPNKETGVDEEVTGETADLFVAISGLMIDRDYTVSVYAVSTDEVYTDSEKASVTFTMTHTQAWTVEGTYTSGHLGKSFPVTMIAYDDNSYSLMAWYGVDYYNFDFSVDDSGVITPSGYYNKNSKGEYVIPTGDSNLPEIYLSTDLPSTFSGNERSGEINIHTCNYGSGTDTFIWVPARQEIWRAQGTYRSAANGKSYTETLIAYDDNTYTLEPWYGVNGFNLEFRADPNDNGGIAEILNAEGYYDYGYWVNTGLDDDYYGVYIWPGYDSEYPEECSYISGGATGGTLRLYVYPAGVSGAGWCVDVFIWGNGTGALTIDDLVGEYDIVTSGYQYIETTAGDFSYDNTLTITKSAGDPNSLVFDNFYWSECPIVGKVDLKAMTVTFQPQAMGYYTFAGNANYDTPVVGTISSNCVITVEGWNGWYNFGTASSPEWYSYFENTKTVFTKK